MDIGPARRQAVEWHRWTYRRAFSRELPAVLWSRESWRIFKGIRGIQPVHLSLSPTDVR
jgi:hypothetical protein